MINAPNLNAKQSFSEIARTLWRYWRIVVIPPIICFLLAILYLRSANYVYTATLIVTPVSSITSPTSSLTRGLGGIASIAGIDLSGSSNELLFNLYLAGLTSRLTAEKLSKDQALMHSLFASYWSPETNSWRQPNSFFKGIKDGAKRALGLPVFAWHPPGATDLQNFLVKSVKVTRDRQTQIVTVTLTYPDPKMAAFLLNKLDSTVDGVLRGRALERSSEAIAYINRKLQTSTVSDYRASLIETLSDQEKSRMMASSNLPFVAETFGDAGADPLPSWPKPTIVLLLSLILGFGIGGGLPYIIERYWNIITEFLNARLDRNKGAPRHFWMFLARLLPG